MRLLLVFLLAGSAFCSEQSDKEYQAAVEKAKAEFDAKVKVAKDKYVVQLKTEMADLTKKGDLDGAVAIRDRIASFDQKAEDLAVSIVGTFKMIAQPGDLTTTWVFTDSRKALENNKVMGTWAISGSTITITYDKRFPYGTVILTQKDQDTFVGTNTHDSGKKFEWVLSRSK